MQHELLTIENRESDSPFVERIWTARSERAGEFLSVAAGHWEMVVTRLHGRAFLTVRGPETRATPIDCPPDGDWVGVRFKLGTFWPAFLPGTLRDRRDVTLPGASTRSFWLSGSAWEYPTYRMRTRSSPGSCTRACLPVIPSSTRCSTVDAMEFRCGPPSGASSVRPASAMLHIGRSNARGTRRTCCERAFPSSMSYSGPDTTTSRTSRARSNT